ncbi:uncharacterized protein LOC111398306 [Olea europaea var. sylvestris]|uniref:uncharacterized protein LOC111398306 n=1 Tax=Olea europaea var. sylvestris TaxID=158386 RepID=UPI000C1CDDDC|nr:uncharacterized protein LOC111398306 [Olea europaea var. sylvestris]
MVIQNQQASIHNLKKQVGQIAAALANRPQDTLSSDTEKNLKEHVLAVEALNYAIIETPSIKPTTPVRAYAITQRNRVQLPEITVKKKMTEENQVKATVLSNKHTPSVTSPQRLQNNKIDKQLKNFLNTIRQLHINIPFIDTNLQIPNYANFLKKMLTKKRKLLKHETIALFEEKLELGDPKGTSIILQLADRSLKQPYGIVEDMHIKAREFIFPVDFIILDIEEAYQMPIILRRPFLSTSRALLDFDANEIVLRVEDKQQSFTMKNSIKQPLYFEDCH